ncbi:hypothetical protein JW890_08115 [candidate division WOR-3 bacterium]|nr:hypothetical protein [candidate division WOR-3 bacterium]
MKDEMIVLARFPGRMTAYRLMNALSAEMIVSSVENPQKEGDSYSVVVEKKNKIKAKKALRKFMSSGRI